MKKFHYKAIVLVSPASSFASMGLALLVVRLLASANLLANLVSFEATYMAMLLLVILTPVFSSAISFVGLYLLAKEAKAFNAWVALFVSLFIDAAVGFPILVLSAIASR